jgi:hypothetical protein
MWTAEAEMWTVEAEMWTVEAEMWTVEAETHSRTYVRHEYNRIVFDENRPFSTLYEDSFYLIA